MSISQREEGDEKEEMRDEKRGGERRKMEKGRVEGERGVDSGGLRNEAEKRGSR